MTRAVEFLAFIGLAASVHVGAALQFGLPGVQSQGSGGEASVTLIAASDSMAAQVAAWSRPTEAMQAVAMPKQAPAAPSQSLSMPTPAQPQPQNTLPSVQAIPKSPAAPDAAPRIDTQSAEPSLAEHAPKSSPRPRTRPEKTPAPTPRQSQAASKASSAKKAKGGTEGRNAGNTKTRQSASLSAAERQSLMARWGASIRNQVERRKRYPSGTTASGKTVLRLTVTRAGRLAGVAVLRSSGSSALDKAAVRAVRRARYAAAPEGLGRAQYSFNLPVTFTRN
ncbi:TonB family protein [Rhodobacteraceae bacterium 63075]|nr:TonB family protein [Rhodobacteraceae bacterium 63075]